MQKNSMNAKKNSINAEKCSFVFIALVFYPAKSHEKKQKN
jgi:hypothetical protein